MRSETGAGRRIHACCARSESRMQSYLIQFTSMLCWGVVRAILKLRRGSDRQYKPQDSTGLKIANTSLTIANTNIKIANKRPKIANTSLKVERNRDSEVDRRRELGGGLAPAPRSNPHGGLRPSHQKSTRLAQSTFGPYVVQIWSRTLPILGETKFV